MTNRIVSALIALSLMTVSAHAASLDAWDYSATEPTWRASAVIGQPLTHGGTGVLGTVDDMIVTEGGQVDRLVIRSDAGFAQVPFQRVEVMPGEAPTLGKSSSPGDAVIATPLDRAGPAEFRVKPLIGSNVDLNGQRSFGLLHDVLFTPSGGLAAWVIDPDGSDGRLFAVPFRDSTTGLQRLTLPYTPEDVLALEGYIYPDMQAAPPR